jgi:hypothetical protein
VKEEMVVKSKHQLVLTGTEKLACKIGLELQKPASLGTGLKVLLISR